MINRQEDLWDEYSTLCKEVKDLVMLRSWNEVVEIVKTDLEGKRKIYFGPL